MCILEYLPGQKLCLVFSLYSWRTLCSLFSSHNSWSVYGTLFESRRRNSSSSENASLSPVSPNNGLKQTMLILLWLQSSIWLFCSLCLRSLSCVPSSSQFTKTTPPFTWINFHEAFIHCYYSIFVSIPLVVFATIFVEHSFERQSNHILHSLPQSETLSCKRTGNPHTQHSTSLHITYFHHQSCEIFSRFGTKDDSLTLTSHYFLLVRRYFFFVLLLLLMRCLCVLRCNV